MQAICKGHCLDKTGAAHCKLGFHGAQHPQLHVCTEAHDCVIYAMSQNRAHISRQSSSIHEAQQQDSRNAHMDRQTDRQTDTDTDRADAYLIFSCEPLTTRTGTCWRRLFRSARLPEVQV